MARNVGLFGGSFNPPHVCHTMTSLWAMHTHPLDEVWWMPTYQHAFGKQLVSFEERMRMCELATRTLQGVRTVEVERELGGESRTVDTVAHLQARHPDTNFWLIVGADIMAETHKWKDWEGLMQRVRLILIGRMGHQQAELEARGVHFTLPDISSTDIRARLAAHGTQDPRLAQWVDARVLSHIDQNGLYGPGPQGPSS